MKEINVSQLKKMLEKRLERMEMLEVQISMLEIEIQEAEDKKKDSVVLEQEKLDFITKRI